VYRFVWAAVALVGLTLDVGTKILAVNRLEPNEPIRLLGGLLTLRLIRNPGAAFSQGAQFTYVFAGVAVVVLTFVVIRLGAGVSGNLADRLFRPPGPFRGHVVDFLELPHWPIFNVADMCISGAAVLIMVLAVVRNVGLDGSRAARD
jgi:signal peptidase II